MKRIITTSIMILQGAVLVKMGYPPSSWQWWAIILLTPLYSFAIEFLD